jgi:hypothetical protein
MAGTQFLLAEIRRALPLFANKIRWVNVYCHPTLSPDGRVRDLYGFGVIDSVSAIGREYDQRYFRLGARPLF